ncbi:ROK family protein [Ponticaulis koreensis]|uniref:ROK family protein n=1 Tax=Ponticaulis koreensis TaxID=1123045 RepID=UPI0003B78E9E|nr:ROK family protein [Ponticaulis koreensis]
MPDSEEIEIIEYAEAMNRWSANERDLGCISLTKDSIFFGVARSLGPVPGQVQNAMSKIDLCVHGEIQGSGHDSAGLGTIITLTDVALALKLILQYAPQVTHVAVASFGPFVRLGKYNRENNPDEYGRFPKHLTNYPEWSGESLYQRSRTILADILNVTLKELEIEILVCLDVNVSALGEHYFELDRLFDKDEEGKKLLHNTFSLAGSRVPSRIRQTDMRKWNDVAHWYQRWSRTTTAYVKISHSVNVGFTDVGWIGRGRHHAQMNAHLPRKLSFDGQIDDFPGSCSIHGDCLEGLVSVHALSTRIRTHEDPKLRNDEFLQFAKIGDPIWDIAAAYVADFCHLITKFIAPRRIAIGGLISRGPNGTEQGKRYFLTLVRNHFEQRLKPANSTRNIPAYEELEDLTKFITYRICPWPGVFGGLIVARWDKTNLTPVGTFEHNLVERNRGDP